MKKPIVVNIKNPSDTAKSFEVEVGEDLHLFVDWDDVDHAAVMATVKTLKEVVEENWNSKIYHENLFIELKKEWDEDKELHEDEENFETFAKSRGWKKSIPDKRMPAQYRAMIYFAHSTMMIYDKDIKSSKEMTIGEFREQNPELVQRVFDEGLSILNYELSWTQVDRAIHVYLISKYNPSSVHERPVFNLQ